MGELSKKTIIRFDKAGDSFRSARRSIRRGNERETLEQMARSFELYIPAVVAAFQDVKHELNLLESKLDKMEIKIDKLGSGHGSGVDLSKIEAKLDKMEGKMDKMECKFEPQGTGQGSGVDLSKIEAKLDKMEGKMDKMECKFEPQEPIDIPPVDLTKIEAKLDKILLIPTVTEIPGEDPPGVVVPIVTGPGVRR